MIAVGIYEANEYSSNDGLTTSLQYLASDVKGNRKMIKTKFRLSAIKNARLNR